MNSREAFIAWSGSDPVELELNQSSEDRDTYFAWQAWDKAWQASRKQLLKELSDKEPVAWRIKPSQYSLDKDLIAEHRREFTPKKNGVTDTTFWVNDCPLIIRPTEEE